MHLPADPISARWRLLRQDPVQATVWLQLARDYAGRDLPVQAAYCARQAAALAPEQVPALDVLPIGAWRADQQMRAAVAPSTPAHCASLVARFRHAVTSAPGDWLSWLFLARLADIDAGGRPAHTPAHAQTEAEALEPINGETLHWLGRWRLADDDAAGAIAALSRLLDIRPVRYGSMLLLGEALLRANRANAAEKAFARASLSNNPAFLLDLAARVFAHNYWKEAIAILDKALVLCPDSLPHLLQLANIQHDTFALADCRATIARIRELDPGNREAVRLATSMHGRMGDARAHYEALRQAYADGGDPLSRLASSIAMVALYHDGLAPAEVAALHRAVCAPIAAACATPATFTNPRTPDRALRIGYVSGDLHRQHPVNLFMLPVLQRQDRRRFEICVYHTGILNDGYTRMFRACSDRWVQADAMDDSTLRRAIVDDGVDILIDLAGHTATHRLGVFAMRAAPVQATFLGYPHSTGLPTIDWLIGDPVVSPADHAHLFSEGIAQLPASVFCWAPVDDYPLPPLRAPGAPLVFGSFNNVLKLSPRTIALWARILHAVPDASLMLKSASLEDAGVRARFAGLFGEHGIGADRLLLRGPTGLDAMMQEYGEVDIALDPTPYNGGTTTLQALWMGVPVLTLEGGNFVSRMGASFLRALGRAEWVADDEAGYVALAVALAHARGAVRAGRAALRATMQASALADIDTYVRHFEQLLRALWSSHCDGDGRRLLTAAMIDQDG